MSVSKTSVDQYGEVMTAIRDALGHYDIPEGLSGVACMKGTLTSHVNNLQKLSAELIYREPNAKDVSDLERGFGVFEWLSNDSYVTKDFGDIDIILPSTLAGKAYPEIVTHGPVDQLTALSLLSRLLRDLVLANSEINHSNDRSESPANEERGGARAK